MNICAVIFKAELIQSRMFPDEDFYGRSIAVFHDVRQCFFYNADKAIFDIAWNLIRDIIGDTYRAEGEVADQAVNSVFQIDRFIMKIVHTERMLFMAALRESSRLSIRGAVFGSLLTARTAAVSRIERERTCPTLSGFPWQGGYALSVLHCRFHSSVFPEERDFSLPEEEYVLHCRPCNEENKFQFLIF